MGEKAKTMTVSGTVDFYGYVDNFNGDGKEYKLAIKEPVFKNLDWDVIKNDWYKGKKLPSMYEKLEKGEAVDMAYFKSSQYPITRVSVYNKEDGTITGVDVTNPQLKDMTVLMKLNKLYIGAIMTDSVPEEFKPSAFADVDDLGDDLPF